MSSVVVDTHVAIWYFLQSSRLSSRAISALDATKAGESIYLSAISLVLSI
jgi:PIN domain nuclease of toxin-antitoxin system